MRTHARLGLFRLWSPSCCLPFPVAWFREMRGLSQWYKWRPLSPLSLSCISRRPLCLLYKRPLPVVALQVFAPVSVLDEATVPFVAAAESVESRGGGGKGERSWCMSLMKTLLSFVFFSKKKGIRQKKRKRACFWICLLVLWMWRFFSRGCGCGCGGFSA